MHPDILLKLDLYQIIAFAKEGKTEQVIERARQMLNGESLVALSDEQWRELGQMTAQEVALSALMFRATIEKSQSATQPNAA